MPLYRFDTVIQSATGLPRDAIVNTWHFNKNGGGPTDFDNVRDMLRDFFTVASPTGGVTGQRLASFISSVTTTPTVLVKAYEVGATPGSPPDYQSTFDLGTRSAATALPAEVALCISLQAARVDGAAQARRRNRKYIGPFTSSSLAGDGRPTGTLLASLTAAGRQMMAASAASITWDWVVYSGKNDSWYDIHDGWVDNAWDTQRRRGVSPSARTPYTATTPAV